MESTSIVRRSLVPIFALVLCGGVAWQWKTVSGVLKSASAAEAKVPIPAAPKGRGVRAEGRVAAYPGAQVVVGADVGGTVRVVRVQEKSSVKKGELLAEMERSEQVTALVEAQSRVKEADVDIAFFDNELAKAERLLSTNAVPKDFLDKALHDRDAARAHRMVAASTAGRLGAIEAKTRIVSPIDGVVLLRHAEPGETIPSGARLLTIANLARTRIEAEVDEFDAGKMAIGAEVRVTAEGYDASWLGKIEEIPDAVAARSLRPQDPGRPSDTRVLLVKIALIDATPLKLGQRVDVDIRVTK